MEDPKTLKEALNSENFDKWLDPIKDEIKFMANNDVWDLVRLPLRLRLFVINKSSKSKGNPKKSQMI